MAFAASPPSDQQLARCLHRAAELPDQAAFEAGAWIKKGGGDAARLCQAYADFNRGEFEAAAEGFAPLAARREKTDRKEAVKLHVQAGLAAMRADHPKWAEREFSAALRIEPQDPDVLVDRAISRAANDKYWEALADLDRALEIMPDVPEALRLRGQVRVKLGQDAAAKRDFEYARMIEDAEAGGSAAPKK